MNEKPESNWARIRIAIFKRDNWTCQSCGYNESWTYLGRTKLLVHHWRGLSYYKEDNRLSNLITLCYDCHGKERDINRREEKFELKGGEKK